LERAPRLGEALGVDLLVKREDLSGYALGGNKLRQIDLLLAEAIDRGADTVVTTAGLQSNFCRALAAGAAKAGLGCVLLLRGEAPAAELGNLMLDRLFGAQIRFVPPLDPWSEEIVVRLEAVADELRRGGRRPHLVHLPGRSAALAAAAWVSGAEELDAQFRAERVAPDAVVVAAGSGLTAAGLALGFAKLGRRCRVEVVSVQQPAPRLGAWIAQVVAATSDLLGLPAELSERASFAISDDAIGPGYGLPTDEAVAMVRLAARTEALVLDPAYTGKALAGLASLVGAGAFAPGAPVVFLHSGGAPGLFAHADVFAGA
jgi:1-aminocyclopropane-1-carboxylate deaminase/D-cysteine desulfhydrase-like pyridoxal-dependent ACC family enzyme